LFALRSDFLSDKITVKKSTINKIEAIVCIIIVLTTVSYYIYDRVILPRVALTTNISQLQKELNSKTSETEQLNTQIADLQIQINNLTQIITPKSNDIVQLNSEINDLNSRLEQANQNITRLTNQLTDAQSTIKHLQAGIQAGPSVIIP
jgi:peptidoglycan hydrolase CwlO-like protein